MNSIISRRLKSIISQTCLTSPTRNLNATIYGASESILTRHFHKDSRSRAENLRMISPKVPQEERISVAESLYNVIKQNGPLSIGATWDLIKEGTVNRIDSKTNMKLMLKWMRGRDMLKQFCIFVGSNKQFLLTTLPEDPNIVLPTSSEEPKRQTQKKNATKALKLKRRKKLKKEQTQKQKQQSRR